MFLIVAKQLRWWTTSWTIPSTGFPGPAKMSDSTFASRWNGIHMWLTVNHFTEWKYWFTMRRASRSHRWRPPRLANRVMIWQLRLYHRWLSVSRAFDRCRRNKGIACLTMRCVRCLVEWAGGSGFRFGNEFQLLLFAAHTENHQKVQLSIMYDGMHGGYDFEQMRLSAVLLSWIRWDAWLICESPIHWASHFSDMRLFAKKFRQCSLHDVKCLRDNRREFWSRFQNTFGLLLTPFIHCRRFFKFETTGKCSCFKRD